jgi:hypothetical protein
MRFAVHVNQQNDVKGFFSAGRFFPNGMTFVDIEDEKRIAALERHADLGALVITARGDEEVRKLEENQGRARAAKVEKTEPKAEPKPAQPPAGTQPPKNKP